MFSLKRLCLKRNIIKYQFIQTCSVYQYHRKSTTYTIHQNNHTLSYINKHLSYHTNTTKLYSFVTHYNHHNIKPTLYHHSKHTFTVTPLEQDGTLSLLQYGNKQIYLLGTAHISTKSADVQLSNDQYYFREISSFIYLFHISQANWNLNLNVNNNSKYVK